MYLLKYTGLVVFVILFVIANSFAESDSLEKKLKSMPEDTNKIIVLNKLSKKYRGLNADKALEYANMAMDLASKFNYQIGIAESYKNIAMSYWRMGTYDIAIENNLKALELFEEIKNKQGIATTNNNMGILYLARNQFQKAIKYLLTSVDLCTEIKDSIGIARAYSNLGLIYNNIQKYDTAIDYHQKSLKLCLVLNDTALLSNNYCFIGQIDIKLNKLDEAYNNLSLSLDLFQKINSINDIATVYNQFALYYNKIGNHKKAIAYSQLAYNLGDTIGNRYMQMEALALIGEAYYGLKDYKKAYETRVKLISLQDSMQNVDFLQSITQKETQYEYIKKMKASEVTKKNELYKSNFILYSSFFFSAILLIVMLIIYIFYIAKTKSNKLLIEKNSEVELQKIELSNLNNKLMESNATKDKFFSIIAHDLRNPLGSFSQTTKSLFEDYNDFTEDDRKKYLELMKKSADNIYSLLGNLLDWSRSQQGTIPFNPTEFDFRILASNTLQIISLSANIKKIALKNNIHENVIVLADPNLITTVLRNLLSNAIKFTPENGIISINSELNNGNAIFSVKDNGIGMSKETIDKLFRIDINVTTLGTSKERGTGLGLILCKEFISKHGGKIWVESEVGVGSTFFFTLPIKPNHVAETQKFIATTNG